MGVNNRQRRAAKQRKRARQRQGSGSRPDAPRPLGFDPGWNEEAVYGAVELQAVATVRRLTRRAASGTDLHRQAESLVRRVRPHPHHVLETVLADVLARLARDVVDGGWGPTDLEQLVRRRADPGRMSLLDAVLHEDPRRLRFDDVEAIAAALELGAVLASAPLLDAQASAGAHSDSPGRTEHPKLAQVRALLAKAESTDYDEEAEALFAKAQELMSRYALDRLLVDAAQDTGGSAVQTRRIWLDAPYVRAKTTLVHHVACANRCRSAAADRLGFSLVVGAQTDLDAVELLVTSLLVQADTALLRHGRRFDESGVPRTRSFRQSFLMAYAVRVGERLEAANQAVTSEDDGRLLPVVRDHEAKVSDAFDAMVPHTVGRSASISNDEGWAAGLVAGDLALLDVNGKLSERTG